jgi:sugar lactone lactonase YvrE
MKTMNLSRFLCSLAGCLLLAAAGCTTTKKAEPKPFTFFPSAPDEPRLQFLTAFESDATLGKSRRFIDFIVGDPPPSPPLVKPYGLAVHDGQVFVCDTVSYVIQIFDFKNKRSAIFNPKGEGKMQLPINITIDADGTRYVADTGREQVLIYNAQGVFLSAMGKKDEMKPSDVAISADRLYITDLAHHAVRVYNKATRSFLFSIPADEKNTAAKLFQPTNLALDQQGHLLVSDTGGNVVQIYDVDGKFIRTIGRQGVAPGLFARPKGISVDREGHVYVVDAATQVVQIFDMEGHLLLFFGLAGATTQGEVVLPAAVEVDYDSVPLFQKYVAPAYQCDYLVFVTSQFGGQKVSVYGYLKKKTENAAEPVKK